MAASLTSGAGVMRSRKMRLSRVTSAMVRGFQSRYRSDWAITDPGTWMLLITKPPAKYLQGKQQHHIIRLKEITITSDKVAGTPCQHV
jgi:hypothetical protein